MGTARTSTGHICNIARTYRHPVPNLRLAPLLVAVAAVQLTGGRDARAYDVYFPASSSLSINTDPTQPGTGTIHFQPTGLGRISLNAAVVDGAADQTTFSIEGTNWTYLSSNSTINGVTLLQSGTAYQSAGYTFSDYGITGNGGNIQIRGDWTDYGNATFTAATDFSLFGTWTTQNATFAAGSSISNGGHITATSIDFGQSALTLQSGSVLQAGSISVSSYGSVSVLGSAELNVTGSGYAALYCVVQNGYNPGGIVKTGTGTLDFANVNSNNTFSGGLTVAAGRAEARGAGSLGAGKITFTGGTLVYGASNLDFSSQFNPIGASYQYLLDTNGADAACASTLSGAGGLTKLGAGTLTLSAANTYAGGTTINAGVLSVASAASLGSGNITFGGGTLRYGPGMTTDLSPRIVAPSAGKQVSIDTGGNNAVFATAISGAGGLEKAGAGMLTLAADNNYTGPTTVSGGELVIGSGATTGTLGQGAVSVAGQLTFNRNDVMTVANDISGTGKLVTVGSGTTVLTGDNTYGITGISSYSTLQIGNHGAGGSLGTGPVTDHGTLVIDKSNTTVIGNDIAGTGAFIQQGNGTTVFDGNVSYIGTTTITAGTLQINDGAIPLGPIVNNSTLVLNVAAPLNVLCTTPISGSGNVVQQGSGALTMHIDNSYTGITSVRGGTLQVSSLADGGVTSGIGSATNAALNLQLDGGTLRYVGTESSTDRLFGVGLNGATIEASGTGGLTFSNTGTVAMLGTGNRTITLSGTSDGNVMAPVIGNAIKGTTSLVKDGSGTWILTGNNSYAGTTTIANGTLVVGDGNDYGTLGSGSIAVASGGNLTINHSDTVTLAAITGAGSLAHTGVGTTVLSRDNSYGGGTTIAAGGTLQVGSYGASGSLGTGTVINDGSLVLTRTDTLTLANVISGTGNLTQQGSGTVILTGANTYSGGTSIWGGGTLQVNTGASLGSGAIGDDGTLVLNTNFGAISLGTMTGGGSLVQQGLDTTILTRNSPQFFGTITISAGTLQVGNGGTTGTLGAAPGNGPHGSGVERVINNGTLAINRSNNITIPQQITGTGSLSQIGTGTTTLSGTSNYSGTTTISNGTLRVTGDVTSGRLDNYSTLRVDPGGSFTITRSGSNNAGASLYATGATLDFGNSTNGMVNYGLMSLEDTTVKGKLLTRAGSPINITNAVTFNGVVSGGGNFTGAGTTTFAGAFLPGDVTGATVSFDGNVIFGPSSVTTMELGASGSDLLAIAGTTRFDGTLHLVTSGNFSPTVGNSFLLFALSSAPTGSFSSIQLPSLPGDSTWDTSDLYSSGSISVVPVPEPVLPMAACGLLLGAISRRRPRHS